MRVADMDGMGDGGRRAVATLLAVTGATVWTHAAAALVGAPDGSAVALTMVSIVAALMGGVAKGPARAAALAAGTAALAVGVAALGGTPAPGALAVSVPVAAAVSGLRPWLEGRLPQATPALTTLRPALLVIWVVLGVVSVVQVGRLATYMTDPDSDWFLSTRHPLYAKHECLSAYIYGAELDRRGEPNVYDGSHYPGLNPSATPHTEVSGMTPDDPYQYPPPFLLLPRLALELTDDYHVLRAVWLASSFTLCIGAVLALAAWVGGRVGGWAMLGLPFVMASFPVLHNLQYGQFHFAAVAMAVLALIAFSSGRLALGGSLLAFATLAKIFPAFVLVPLAVQRRWRELLATALAGTAISGLALAWLGGEPFVAFFDYQLPRLSGGQAFAFGTAWPELATLVTAGNQGIQGIVQKLGMLGAPWADQRLAHAASDLYLVALLGIGAFVGLLSATSTRAGQAAGWLGLLALASLGSAGAWADYVPLTAVWALTFVVPLAASRPGPRWLVPALTMGGALQFSLIGTMPVGEHAAASWMLPTSLVSAVVLLGLGCASVVIGAQTATAPTLSREIASRWMARLYGALTYVATVGSFYVLFAFLIDAGLPRTVDRGPSSPVGIAFLVDLALVAFFGLQHTAMARPRFKRWWTRYLPERLERSTYMVGTLIALGLLYWQWRPIPFVVWDLSGTAATAALGLYVLGWMVLFLTMFLLDHLELAGLRQTWLDGRGGGGPLKTPLLYGLVRHPMMVGWLMIFWATPSMTAGHLLLAGAMTLYILIGLYFEERNLVDAFGDDYRRYQQAVPKLIPFVRRNAPRALPSPARPSRRSTTAVEG